MPCPGTAACTGARAVRLARFLDGKHPNYSVQAPHGPSFRPSRSAIGWLLGTRKRLSADSAAFIADAGGGGSVSDFGSAAHQAGVLATLGLPRAALQREVALLRQRPPKRARR